MIEHLVDKYQNNRSHYLSNAYNEAQLRIDFLDPLFELLGWDIQNKQAKATYDREVVVEVPLKSSSISTSKKPDYAFRQYSEKKFFLEAKKPSNDITISHGPAHQIRRYGFTAKMKISVLSNFEYLAIYDCSQIVLPADGPSNSRVKLYHYTEYVEKFSEIKELLGKDSVYSGAFDQLWSSIEEKLEQFSVDDIFLTQINKWRLQLGAEIIRHDSNMPKQELNDLVQSYLNSIIFLRVCEDRSLEEYKSLLDIATTEDFTKLVEKFKIADKKYNSGLFHLNMTEQVIVNSASSFWNIIAELYFPTSVYSFSIIPSDILGRIYEIFLGDELTVNADGELCLMKKPEHVDRDIVTTPTYIIKDMLASILKPKIENLAKDKILEIKIADIACGSGAFLLEAYQLINDQLIDHFLKTEPGRLIQVGVASYKLPFSLKREVLEKCIFGIDKDFGAVEACKFGLLLKLLEDENNETIVIPALPSLEKNIVYGNSLVDTIDISEADRQEINPLTLSGHKFDFIFGNPPYMSTEDMKKFTPKEYPIYKRKFMTAYKQFDKYFLFIERGISLLSDEGALSYIVPNKFMKVGAGLNLRRLLKGAGAIAEITSFGAQQVFKDKSTYTCILDVTKKPRDKLGYCEVEDIQNWKSLSPNQRRKEKSEVETQHLDDEAWVLVPAALQPVKEKILENCEPLGGIVGPDGIYNGIQTSANNIYIHTASSSDESYIYFIFNGTEYRIERELTRPYFKTLPNDASLSSYRMLVPNSFVIYPYKNIQGQPQLVDIGTLKSQYPSAYMFLNSYKTILGDPKRDIKPEPTNDNEWYRYGRHQSLEKCDVDEKLVVGVLSQGNKYAVDTNRTLISSGGTAGYCMITLPKSSPYSIYYIQAILNSKYTEWYASLIGEVFRGGYIARGTKVLKRLPIKQINFAEFNESETHDRIAHLQQRLISLSTMIDSAGENTRAKVIARRAFDESIMLMDQELKALYGLESMDDLVPTMKGTYAVN